MTTTPENIKSTKYPDKDTTVEDNDDIKQEIKEEPGEDYTAYTLYENFDIALRDGHLGLAGIVILYLSKHASLSQ